MEKRLTQEQIDQLFEFTKKHLVEHYDVQVELVDHLANAIEAQWKENPHISFEDALNKEYKSFGVFGFSGLVEQKQAALERHYWTLIKHELVDFVSIPKVILTGMLFYVLFQFFKNPTELKEIIWFGLKITLLVFTFVMLIYQKRQLKKTKNKFLLQSLSNQFYSIPVTMIVFFSSNIHLNASTARLLFETTTTTLYILFCVILFTKVIPLLRNEITQTEQKFQIA